MVGAVFTPRLFGLSLSGVRKIGYAHLLRAMQVAEGAEGLAHGNRAWLEGHCDDAQHFYLVPLPRRDHRGFVKCALLIIDKRNRGVWMNLDVHRRLYSKLPRVGAPETEKLVLNLAVRFPFVRMPEDSMFDPNIEFD